MTVKCCKRHWQPTPSGGGFYHDAACPTENAGKRDWGYAPGQKPAVNPRQEGTGTMRKSETGGVLTGLLLTIVAVVILIVVFVSCIADASAKTSDHVTICHRTGSSSHPYVQISPSASGVFHGHLDHEQTGNGLGGDIIPPFEYKGQTYSKNWDAAGQAIWNNGCKIPASPSPSPSQSPSQSPSTSPSQSPSETPSETPSSSPSDSPSETTTPSVQPSESNSPTQTPSVLPHSSSSSPTTHVGDAWSAATPRAPQAELAQTGSETVGIVAVIALLFTTGLTLAWFGRKRSE